MSIWQRFLYLIGLRPKPGPRYFELTENFQKDLTALAQLEGRPEDEVFPDLLAAGLNHLHSQDLAFQQWESLTPREQDVAALVCLGYTNPEIARLLFVSTETVKKHVSNVLAKFRVESRGSLRQILSEWDFSAWV